MVGGRLDARRSAVAPCRGATATFEIRSELFPKRNYEAQATNVVSNVVGGINVEIVHEHKTARAEIVADKRPGTIERGLVVGNDYAILRIVK